MSALDAAGDMTQVLEFAALPSFARESESTQISTRFWKGTTQEMLDAQPVLIRRFHAMCCLWETRDRPSRGNATGHPLSLLNMWRH